LVAGGREIQRIYNSTPPVKEEINEIRVPLVEIPLYANAILRLESYFAAKSNPRLERQLLSEMKQEAGETFNAFVVRLRVQAIRCGFEGERINEEVYFQIMQGARSEKVKHYATTEAAKSLDNLISYGINDEIKEQQNIKQVLIEKAENGSYQQVAAIKQSSNQTFIKSTQNRLNSKCFKCGSAKHFSGNRCPAFDAKCRSCGKVGHFARVCLKRRRDYKNNWSNPKRENINQVMQEGDWDELTKV
jgi:hypothetical protein